MEMGLEDPQEDKAMVERRGLERQPMKDTSQTP